MADAPCKCRQQVSHRKGCQSTHKAEDAELRVCHAYGADVDLNTKPHEVDLLQYTGEQGIQQMCALVNEVVGGKRSQNGDVLSCSF